MNAFRKIKFILVLTLLTFIPGIASSQLLTIEEIKITHKDTESFDDDALISALGLNESDVYNPLVLSENIYKLQKFYFDNGFFDAKIDTSVKYDLSEEEVYIKIIIKENKHYKIDSLIYSGLDSIPEKTGSLLKKIKVIGSHDYYDRALINQQTNEMIDLLQNNGFMNARLKQDSGTVVRKYSDPVQPRLTVTIYFIGTDSIFYFGKTDINISENKYGVDKKLLKEEITYNEGDIYSKEKKLKTESNMTKIPIVQSARVSPYEINNGKVDFKAEINLNNKNEISPYGKAIVIDNIFYVGGGAQYINKYFMSGGKVLNLSFDALINSIESNRIEFSADVTQPHAFNSSSYLADKITLGLYNIENSQNYYLGNLTSYLQNFPEYTFYENASLDYITEFVRFNYVDVDTLFTVFNSTLSATLVHDNTNQVFSPSRGFFHSITVGSGGLIPKLIINAFEPNLYYSQYLKLFTSNNFYFNMSRQPGETVLATKFLVGDIIEYGSGDRVVPLQPLYKFFSGGSTSVRGWSARTNGVLSNTSDGGDFLIEGSLEIRQKLFAGSNDFKKNISGAVFFDYGNVWPVDEDFRFDQIALAVGFGVRYNLFIGPIRLDFGFKLYDPASGANDRWLFNDFGNVFGNRFVVQFGIGEAF